jgi:enoyl-CoA hydratase/carnithine racemase
MAADDLLLIEDRGRARLLTLNRPAQLNAFDDRLYRAATAALLTALDDPGIACVAVTGAGRAFSAGQDLAELGDARSHEQRVADGFGPFIQTVERFVKPLIAAVNGIGVGIGLTLLLHCDLVLMAEGARLRAPFASLGVTAEAGSSYLLPARVGWQAAAEILFGAGWVDADRAVAIGLASASAAPERLLDETWARAGAIAAMPIASLTATKRIMLEARLAAVRDARAREDREFSRLVGGPANREAITAFQEKRPADFSKV